MGNFGNDVLLRRRVTHERYSCVTRRHVLNTWFLCIGVQTRYTMHARGMGGGGARSVTLVLPSVTSFT